MHAIIEVGGKQYNVKTGDTILVEKQDSEKSHKIPIKKVLLVSGDGQVKIGQPYLKDVTVNATVVRQTKAKKVISFKYRRRKNSLWKKGHRQQLTELKIDEIKV